MADNLDTPSVGNFSIQDTMEMGMGNQELLDSLFSPETVTTPTEKIQEIKKEEPKKVEKPKVPVQKAKEEEKEEEGKEEKKDPKKELNSFLEDGDEEESTSDLEGELTEETSENSENRFEALSKDLFALGVFSKEDEEEEDVNLPKTPQEFLERFQLEQKKGAIQTIDKFLSQFGEDYQAAFQAIYVNGVSPKEYFGAYNNIQDFSSLDLKDEQNQIAVIKQALLDQGFETEDISTEVERIKNYGDLETVAQKHHKVLIKKEAAKIAKLQEESTVKIQQQAAVKNQFVKNVQTVLEDKLKNKEFDGIPINPKLATELQDFLVTDKYKTPSGETLTEFDRTILDLKRPENHEKKVKLALLLKILEKDPTLSTIQKAGISKKTDALFGELARQTGKSPIKKEKEKEKTEKATSWFS